MNHLSPINFILVIVRDYDTFRPSLRHYATGMNRSTTGMNDSFAIAQINFVFARRTICSSLNDTKTDTCWPLSRATILIMY